MRAIFLLLAAAVLATACASTDSGPTTGIILDARVPRGAPALTAVPPRWCVMDPDRVEICSSDELSRRNGWKGVYWQKDGSLARSRDARKWVGPNPILVRVSSVERSKDGVFTRFIVDQETATTLRELPGFRDFVRRADLEIVFGCHGG